MPKLPAILRLIRLPNLLIVGLTQYLIYYLVLRPALVAGGIQPVFDAFHFLMLVKVTVIITACGYISNDLFDQEVDKRNRPEKRLVGQEISVRFSIGLAIFLMAVGLAIALYLADYVGNMNLIFLYPLALAGLAAYNNLLKRLPLIGNLVIALFCAGVAAILGVAEAPSLHRLHVEDPMVYRTAMAIFGWYMAFAFLSTLCREIVKDLEDMAGDGEAGYRTAPIVWGEGVAKWLGIATGILLAVFILAHGWMYGNSFSLYAMVYIAIAIFFPLLYILWKFGEAKSPAEYHKVSWWLKGIMVTGLGLLLWV